MRDLLYAADKTRYDPSLNREAVIALKEAFSQAKEAIAREGHASMLIKLGQKDDTYWLTLSRRAQAIVDDRTPYPLAFDEKEISRRDYLSPEFAAAKAPSEIKEQIAQSLLFFDNPIAQAAAERMISNKELLASLEMTAKEQATRGLW